jgi:transcriptional regulator with XRE-family HTH domain
VTAVAGTGSPTARRRELGSILRTLRTDNSLTVEQAAEQLLVSPSKISRLENGQRGASARDIRDLCNLYGVDDETRQLLTDLAAEGKQRAWWQSLSLPYSTYVGLEADAVSIRDFGLGIVPGLLQTTDYARAIVHAANPRRGAEELEVLVRARRERQDRVLGTEPPTFSAIMDEAVLHRVVGGPAVMEEQLRWLRDASLRPNMSIRIVPYAAGALPTGNNKFIILSFDRPSLTDVVYIESLTGELILERESDLEVYNDAYRTLSDMAASAEDSRGMMTRLLEHGYAR